ncbi:MAG TPA: Nramp family divalent metal transporter [Nitrolancea sp.]|jgi:NRAMP (natural resistance-associated macrophage protein)-like metal ion transporter|nr:Nramp family divalent metal transporter [Nitrolancea sp.]
MKLMNGGVLRGRMWLSRRVPRRLRVVTRLSLPKSGIFAYLAIMGPGLITANAGNDAGAIATYSSAGARYGYNLLWMILLMTFSLAVVQEMAARMGVITGKGLTDLIRENFGIRYTALAMVTLLIANAGIIVSEFSGIAASAELLGISRFIAVPLAGFIIWWLVSRGSYSIVERVFLLFTLVFLVYIVSAVLAHPDWGMAAKRTVVPSIQLSRGYLLLFVATVGTTITPYMQLFQQGAVVEKGISEEEFKYERADVYSGAIFANAIAFFIIVASAAAFYTRGITLNSAADAARALEPIAGSYATLLFAIGLFGASMLAAGVLPIATAASMTEVFGFEAGVSRTWRQAPIFHGLFTGLIVLGVVINLIPGLSLFQVLLTTQILNGVLLPVILISMLRLVNNREIMGDHVNGPLRNIVAWGTTIATSLLSVVAIVFTFVR